MSLLSSKHRVILNICDHPIHPDIRFADFFGNNENDESGIALMAMAMRLNAFIKSLCHTSNAF